MQNFSAQYSGLCPIFTPFPQIGALNEQGTREAKKQNFHILFPDFVRAVYMRQSHLSLAQHAQVQLEAQPVAYSMQNLLNNHSVNDEGATSEQCRLKTIFSDKNSCSYMRKWNKSNNKNIHDNSGVPQINMHTRL